MAKTKVKVIVALFAVIALSLLAVCFGRLFSPAEAKAADGTYDDTAAVALMQDLITDGQATLTENVVFDLTQQSDILGSQLPDGLLRFPAAYPHKNVTIDLGGCTLEIITGSDKCCLHVADGITVTVKNGTLKGSSAGSFAWGETGSKIVLEDVDIKFETSSTETTSGNRPYVISTNGSLSVDNVTYDSNITGDPVNTYLGEFIYGTLQDAINAGETSITLDKDYTESITVSKGQNVTIDLNGFTITSSTTKTVYNNGGTLTINGNGKVETTNTASTATAVYNSGSMSSLTINGGTYSAKRPLDIRGANTIDINGGTFNGDAYAIYCYSSSAAISKFSVTDAKITATGTALRPHGVTQFIVDGATEIKGKTAIEVSKGAAEKIDVTLDCGKIEGKVSITNKAITASIKGGDFTNATMNYGSATVSITGGTFAEMPSPTYLASNEYAIYRNGEAGSYTFEIAATASKPDVDPYRTKDDKVTVDDRGFTSVADALEAIKGAEVTGTTIELISDMSENVTIPAGQDITLDLNGFKLTGELAVNGTLTVNEGELDGGITVDANGKLTLNAGVSRSARSAYLEADHSAVLIPSEWLPENYSIEYSEDVEWGSDPYTNEDDSITIYYTVSGKAPVANVQMGEEVYGFALLENAVNAIQGGVTTTVTLLDNVVLTGTIEPDATANITFDLNGKKISTAEGFTSPHVFRIVNSSITIKNGTIENGRAHEESDSVRTVFEIQGDPGYGTKLVLENGVTVTSHNSVAFITGTAQLDVNGAKLSTDGAGSCVIESNASASNNNDTVINITEGSEITSSTGVAIFHPQKGELNITGGTITGATGIVLRGGELNISGDAVVKATGEKKTPEELFATRPDGGTDGALNTGDAVLIYNAGYPAEEMMKDSSITGGKFESENGSAVSSLTHTYNTSTKYEQVNNFISGGEFDGMPESDYIAAGADLYMNADKSGFAVATESAPEGYKKVVATIGDTAYTSLAEAVTAAGENATIVLYADVTESVTVAADDVITLDLNGKTLTSDTDNVATILNNGTLSIVDTSDEKGTITRGATTYYVIRNEGVMTISDVNVENLTSDPSSLVANNTDCKSDGAAQLTIKSGSFTSAASNAVKNDEYGILTIDGGVFETKINTHAAVQTWATATINGGTFTATAQAISIEVYNGQTNTTTINNGTFNAPTAVYMSDGYDVGATYPGGDMNIEIKGGTFNGAIAESATCPIDDEDGGVAISGGTFTKAFDSDYLADNVNLYQTETGFAAATEQNAPENSTKVVAFVRDKAYGSIQAAIDAADGAPVTLYDDVTLSEALTIDKAVTINLNGKTVSASTTAANITANATIKNGTIDYVGETSVNGLVVTNNATLTLEGVTVDYEGSGQAVRLGKGGTPENNGGNAVITDSEIKGGVAGVAMFGTAEGAANKTTLTATDSTITGSVYYGIATNGIFYNNDITLSGTTVKGTSTGMYLPGSGETTITGGSVKGATGIEIRAGKLTIDGATVTATGAYEEPVPNGSGTTVEGVAIAVSQHTTERPIEVTVNGGTFNATGKDGKAFLEIDTVEDEEGETTPSEDVTIAISGGNFTAPVESKNKTEFVSGGNFSEVLDSAYLGENVNMYVSEGKYTAATAENAPENAKLVVAVIGTKGYTSLNAAIADVKAGAASQFSEETTVITLMTDTKDSSDIGTSNGQAPKNVTIDLNGHTLTLGPGVGSAGTETAGLRVLAYSTLTVKNGTLKCSDDTADHIRVGIANYGKTTLENVTLDAAEVTQYPVNNRGELTLKGDTTVENGGVYDIAITNDPYNYYYEDVDASLNIADPEVTVGTVRLELYGNATNNGVPVLNVSAGTLQTIITDGSNAIGFKSNVSGATFEELPDAGLIGDSDMYQTADGKFKASDSTVDGATKVIAMVGDKAYDKLADAVAAATDDGAVTLYVDVKENITVASGTVTIDLAGNTLNGFIKSTGATVNVKNGTVSGSWIDGAVMANGEGASVTLTDTVIGNPISISNDGAVTLVRSTTRGRITVGSGSAPENYTAGTLTITDSIIEKEISVEMLGKVVISDTVEYKTSFASGVKVTAKDPAALEAFKGYGVTTVVHVANEEQLLKALELGVSEIEVQSMELSAPVEITKDVKIYGGNKGDHEIVGSFIVKGEIEVTIEDVSFAGDGTGAALTVTDGAKLTYSDNLSNVTVAVSGFEAGISVDGNSSATVNNITFENISAAAEVKDGKSDAVTFNGCTIPEDTAQYVAVVTDATNLASAIADSKFAKVTLGADVELTSALVIERSVTLDLNGYDITGNINVTAADVTITAPETSDSAINGIVTVTNADDFTLSNVTVNYTVTGEEEADSLKIMGAVVIDGSENATIDNVTVNVTANNSGLNVVSVWVKNDSTATISDSTIDLEFRATEENRTQGQVVRAETSDLTIKDSVITTTDYGVIFYGDMSATDAQADNTAAFDKLVIENSTVTVTDTDEIVGAYAVSGNGSNRNGTIIEITGSTITSDVATAIYHPQYGNMTITDSVITGASGIEMRSGNLTVTSGTITATGAFEVEPNGNGNTASGVAVAVSQHTTEMKINVQLNGGTFNATGENGKAFYETDTVTGVDPSADVTVDLNGGTYEAAVEAKNIKNFINDGLYKEEPKEDAFAEGYEGVLYNGYYQVVEATTDDPAALLTAKTEAQADVRSYLLNACGMTIADVKALAADETLGAAAQAVIDAYAAMDGATSESKLAIARLSVMDAIDALDKALDTALADYKAAAIDEINSYGAEKDVAVPTATIMAINSAKTEAEVDMYKEYAIGEIDDIVAYREAISNIKIPNYSDTLDDLSAKLDTLTGNLTSVSNTLGEKIDAVKTDIATVTADIDKLETTLAGLADSDDVNGIAEDISDIIEQLAAIKSTVDGISVAVDEATAVEEVKTEAAAEIDAWLEDYIDSIVESSATSVRDILTAKAAMADDLRSKLVDAFGEDNAALIEKYYDDAMAAIENATSASEATNAVSTFKAQVASVEAAAGNTTSLAGVYVLLAIILVVAIVAVVLAVVLKRKGGEPAPATAQPAPEAAPAPAPAAETAPAPAATEEAPAAQPEDENAATATDEDTERVVITASTRTFEEAYEALDPELRDLFDKVKAYALSKNGTTEVKLSNCICIKYGSKKVVRLTVRRSYPLAMFVIENEMVKDFRRNATGALKLKVPATELVIRDEEDLKAAYSMVDLAVDQILKDIEAAKERRRAARRARRAQREAEAGEAGETPEAPEAPDDGGKK